MEAMPAITGLVAGITIAAVDFSMAKSITGLIRPSNARFGQVIILGGFLFRFAFIGILLWTLSRASNVNFLAACIGLVGAFTALTLWQVIRALTVAGRQNKQVSDRR